MIIDYDYLASEFTKCYKDKSRIYMIQNYLKTFDDNLSVAAEKYLLQCGVTSETIEEIRKILLV